MKSKRDVNASKKEAESLNAKYAELSDDELEQVFGGRESLRSESTFNSKLFSVDLSSTGK